MRAAVLLSGGIDSPVAAYVMASAGADVMLLHMDNGPYGDPKELEKVRLLAERLREVTGQGMPLFFADHGSSQKLIGEGCVPAYRCVMCKKAMQLTAKLFSIEHGCDAIVLGDSLGQVASQTLRNINAEQAGLCFPVLRPLIGLDKNEIIDIAKRIGTYGISIIQTKGCLAVPQKPVTEATPEKAAEQAERIGLEAAARASADSIRQ